MGDRGAADPAGKPLDIQITATDNGLDVDVRGSGPLPAPMIATLSQLAEQHRLARLTRHGELVLMRNPPVVAIGPAQVTLPPGSFLQATAAGEEKLATLVAGTLQARPSTLPTCFAVSGLSRSGWQRKVAGHRPSTAMPARSRPCRRPQPRPPD